MDDVVTTQVSSSGEDVMYVRIGDRLIFDFEKCAGCIGNPSGIHPDVKHQLPEELSAKSGITAGKWLEWMTDLEEVQTLDPSLAGMMTVFFCPGLGIQALICLLCCPISMNHSLSYLPCCYGDWYESLRKWQEKVNETFNVYGMHAKLLTYRPYYGAPRSKMYAERVKCKDHKYEMSFLVIALTPEESHVLQEESWNHGVMTCCISGTGRSL